LASSIILLLDSKDNKNFLMWKIFFWFVFVGFFHHYHCFYWFMMDISGDYQKQKTPHQGEGLDYALFSYVFGVSIKNIG
jgi:hypothetical protein